jgi:hypothetical protein
VPLLPLGRTQKADAFAPTPLSFVCRHHHMKSLRIAALIVLALFGAQNAHSAITSSFEPENDQLKSALIGVWGASSDGGKTFWGDDEFLSDRDPLGATTHRSG